MLLHVSNKVSGFFLTVNTYLLTKSTDTISFNGIGISSNFKYFFILGGIGNWSISGIMLWPQIASSCRILDLHKCCKDCGSVSMSFERFTKLNISSSDSRAVQNPPLHLKFSVLFFSKSVDSSLQLIHYSENVMKFQTTQTLVNSSS